MLTSRKADANMWWIIIGAVIALIVLIILLVMFTGKTSGLERGLSDCEGKGGVCANSGECPQNTLSSSAFSCTESRVCCIGTPKECIFDSDCDKGRECANNNYGTTSYCK